VSIPCSGDELAAWLYRPNDTAETTGCVVLLHGFTATRDEELDRFCERFADAGIGALAFDFRHLGASGGEPRQLIDLKRQYEDCDAALAFARNLEGIDPARVVVWGTSFAGGHALDAAARHPWIAAAICLVPFVDGIRPPSGLNPGQGDMAL
jgi:dienelactone hydrolase